MRTFFLIALFIASSVLVNGQNAVEELFNGKSLDGWKIYGTEKWLVEDGLLICESGPGNRKMVR